MSHSLAKSRYPIAAIVFFILGGLCFLLGRSGQDATIPLWMIVAATCWLGCLTSLARWLAITAATSTSPLLRAIERVRSYIADEPASYERTHEREANRP